MFKRIICELEHHAPFTFFGAATGIILMIAFRNMSHDAAYRLFYAFHPLHILFSAVVSASIFNLYECRGGHRRKFLRLFAIAYVSAVGTGTLSDSILPYLGEMALGLPNREIHAGFLEEWWLVNLAAIIGIVIGYLKPMTKLPHSGHVLVSTWASLFHMIMAFGGGISIITYVVMFFFLFISVWVPCCFSDIVFPLIFVKGAKGATCGCHSGHAREG